MYTNKINLKKNPSSHWNSGPIRITKSSTLEDTHSWQLAFVIDAKFSVANYSWISKSWLITNYIQTKRDSVQWCVEVPSSESQLFQVPNKLPRLTDHLLLGPETRIYLFFVPQKHFKCFWKPVSAHVDVVEFQQWLHLTSRGQAFPLLQQMVKFSQEPMPARLA